MKKLIPGILLFLIPFQMLGQLFPSSNHYVYNALAINPAFAGCNEALSATLSYRNQWVGFADAPKSITLSTHAPVYYDKIGLGLLIDQNSIGIFKEMNIFGNYAYRMDLYNGKLALGIGFGAIISNIAWNELDANDAGDIQLLNNNTSVVSPNFSMGAYYYQQKFFIGFSIPLFLSNKLDQSNGKYKIENDFSNYNYFLTGGLNMNLNPQLKLVPSLLIKYHPNHAVQIDYNAQICLKDKFWLGIGYRSKNMLVAMLQCQLNYQLRMAYSYDFDLAGNGQYKKSSHEIVLNYTFNYLHKVMGPKQF